MPRQRFANLIAFDDGPFAFRAGGRVKVVGTVFADLRLEGVVIGDVAQDGCDAAEQLAQLVLSSKFDAHAQLIMLQGIALGGFNVVDVAALHQRLARPILVVARKLPDMPAMRTALAQHLPDGDARWRMIAALGPMEPAGKVFIQRIGLSREAATALVTRLAVHSHLPEPLRCAHLIAGALGGGESRGGV
jgi:endonuclease V-like protein UPF0215 family